MTLPNFLVIGAQKSGTTTLCRQLAEHPDVFMPEKKEPHFFSYDEGARPQFKERSKKKKNVVTSLAEYEALFANASGQKAVGEGSTSYIHMAGAAERVRARIPHARLIAILREPVDRCWSHFHHAVRSGREPFDGFEQAIHEEDRRIAEGWGDPYAYRAKGFYSRQLRHWLTLFPREQLFVRLFDDLTEDPRALYREAFAFLGVDAEFVPDLSRKYNVGGDADEVFDYRPGIAERIRMAISPASRGYDPAKKPPFPDALRKELKEGYRADVEDLQELLGRDLGNWLR